MQAATTRISRRGHLAAIPWVELLRYFACSAAALAADMAVFSLFLRLGSGWAVAATAGFCLGLVVAYALSVRFVFAHRRVANARAEFVLFAGIGVFGLLLTMALMWLFIDALHVAPWSAKLLTVGAVFLCNFSLRKLVLFTRRDLATRAHAAGQPNPLEHPIAGSGQDAEAAARPGAGATADLATGQAQRKTFGTAA